MASALGFQKEVLPNGCKVSHIKIFEFSEKINLKNLQNSLF